MNKIKCTRREIRTFVGESIANKYFWIGVHDREEDRVFRFLNGTIYDPSNKEEDHLYHWDEGFSMCLIYIFVNN